jgi:hypothetical protein
VTGEQTVSKSFKSLNPMLGRERHHVSITNRVMESRGRSTRDTRRLTSVMLNDAEVYLLKRIEVAIKYISNLFDCLIDFHLIFLVQGKKEEGTFQAKKEGNKNRYLLT